MLSPVTSNPTFQPTLTGVRVLALIILGQNPPTGAGG